MKIKRIWRMKTRAGCLLISFILLVSSASCGRKIKETEKERKSVPGCVEAAEEILDSLIACDSKSLKMMGGFNNDHAEAVNVMAKTPEIRKAIQKTYYEIDEDNVIEKKSKASVDVDVMFPDYSSIVSEMEISPERFYLDFYDAVSKQSKKEYKTVVFEMTFEIKNQEYILTNPDEIVVKFYTPISDALQEYLDRVPDDYGQRDDGLFSFSNIKKIDLNEERFLAVLKTTDAVAADSVQGGNLDDTSPYTLFEIGNSDHVMYLYAEFATVEECKENSETLSVTAKSGGPFYQFESDWGCSLWQYEGASVLVYYSDKSQIMLSSTDGSKEGENLINQFIEELTSTEYVADSSPSPAKVSIQDFRTKMSGEGFNVVNSTNLRENVIEQVFAGTSDSSIIISYEVYKDMDCANKAYDDWKHSIEAGNSSGQVEDMITDSNMVKARFNDTYTIYIVYDDVVITAIGQPDSEENIALVDKAIAALGI